MAPGAFEQQAKAVRAELRRLAGMYETEELIVRNTEGKYSIPEDKSLLDALKYFKRVWEAEQEEATWQQVYPYRPMDGVHATKAALTEAFGSILTEGRMGFWGPTPPRFTTIKVGPDEEAELPMLGEPIVIPALPEVTFTPTTADDPEQGVVFRLHASGKKECAGEVRAIFDMVGQHLREHSIYRGKAIDDGFNFLDLKGVDPDKVIYAEVTRGELETNIFSRLRHPEALQRLGVDLKGAVLLEGTYGTGKTLAAFLTAIEAAKAGRTFILVRPESLNGVNGVEAFRQALTTAELYAPAVVFVEDVDTLTSADAEADRISTMLDVFDGARAKGREVLVVLTTNHADQIHKGMVRPGRIDAVITIPPPDEAGIVKLCKVLLPEELLDECIPDESVGPEVGWDAVTEAMAGFIPAAVKEACSRAIRYLIVRQEGAVNGAKIGAVDLVRAAEGLQAQMALLESAQDMPSRESLTEAFRYAIRGEVAEVVSQGFESEGWRVGAEAMRKQG